MERGVTNILPLLLVQREQKLENKKLVESPPIGLIFFVIFIFFIYF